MKHALPLLECGTWKPSRGGGAKGRHSGPGPQPVHVGLEGGVRGEEKSLTSASRRCRRNFLRQQGWGCKRTRAWAVDAKKEISRQLLLEINEVVWIVPVDLIEHVSFPPIRIHANLTVQHSTSPNSFLFTVSTSLWMWNNVKWLLNGKFALFVFTLFRVEYSTSELVFRNAKKHDRVTKMIFKLCHAIVFHPPIFPIKSFSLLRIHRNSLNFD